MDLQVRELDDVADLAAVRALFDGLWSSDPANPAMTVEVMRAFAHTGQYVVGGYLDDALVAASVGWFAAPAGRGLHSHVTGVLAAARGRHVGLTLKQHQRQWALARGLDTITWTFDPLVRRNAWFNLGLLGAGVGEYLVDFYGPMADGINDGDESDRLLAVWDLTAAPPDAPREGEAGLEVVPVPPDVESLRRTDPAAARRWRLDVRERLGGALAAGRRVAGFDRERGYLLTPREDGS